jgi:hypothetical protein
MDNMVPPGPMSTPVLVSFSLWKDMTPKDARKTQLRCHSKSQGEVSTIRKMETKTGLCGGQTTNDKIEQKDISIGNL